MATVNAGVQPEDMLDTFIGKAVKPYARSIKYPDAVFVPVINGCDGCIFSKDSKEYAWCDAHPCVGGQWRTAVEAAMHKLEHA
jgi:hypothetical protein